VCVNQTVGAINADSFKMVKATDVKYDTFPGSFPQVAATDPPLFLNL